MKQKIDHPWIKVRRFCRKLVENLMNFGPYASKPAAVSMDAINAVVALDLSL
ncbi:hypothetical protein [Acetobacter conturbans]|uniref:Transposase n=1 Tax=Acetobacter conturbans TaxID=1737472 RepID=A0ABX0K383_9PROT|nr:hypothetical protein [Acetobacter conturbans]NHN87909.1 hypothetical protein [Acetobacter conturbans]